MKKKGFRAFCALIALAAVLAFSACSGEPRMMFGTGGTAGTYYSYGGILAQYMRRFAGVRVTAVSTGGSKVNIQSIQDGDFQLGFCQSDVLTYAWEGSRAFEKDGATHDFKVLGALYAETVQLITMDDDINSVEDLKGKSVSIGQAGSGVYFNALDVLEGAGLSLGDIKPQYQSFEDSKEDRCRFYRCQRPHVSYHRAGDHEPCKARQHFRQPERPDHKKVSLLSAF